MTPEFHLFECFGVELEYMIVRRDDLDVLPVADQVLKAEAGDWVSDVELGVLAWSNEIVLHVIELKTNGPVPSLTGLSAQFQGSIARINQLLGVTGQLLPGGMHPWMDPIRETRLWPHDFSPVYQALDRIFDCRGHGWSNLQSVHMNLPFSGDEEFGRLHAAIRLLMPLMPALAAASPVMDGRVTGLADNRLAVYRENQKRIPSISGKIIPEPVCTRDEYFARILEPMWADIQAWDPEGVLHYEWLNSRGAIARFERNTIEVRVLDVQESPAADLAIYSLIVEVLRALVEERLPGGQPGARSFDTDRLVAIFDATVTDGAAAAVADPDYLALLGLGRHGPRTAGDCWQSLFELVGPQMECPAAETAGRLLRQGTLSQRLVRSLGPKPDREKLSSVYRRLATALEQGMLFDA